MQALIPTNQVMKKNLKKKKGLQLTVDELELVDKVVRKEKLAKYFSLILP